MGSLQNLAKFYFSTSAISYKFSSYTIAEVVEEALGYQPSHQDIVYKDAPFLGLHPSLLSVLLSMDQQLEGVLEKAAKLCGRKTWWKVDPSGWTFRGLRDSSSLEGLYVSWECYARRLRLAVSQLEADFRTAYTPELPPRRQQNSNIIIFRALKTPDSSHSIATMISTVSDSVLIPPGIRTPAPVLPQFRDPAKVTTVKQHHYPQSFTSTPRPCSLPDFGHIPPSNVKRKCIMSAEFRRVLPSGYPMTLTAELQPQVARRAWYTNVKPVRTPVTGLPMVQGPALEHASVEVLAPWLIEAITHFGKLKPPSSGAELRHLEGLTCETEAESQTGLPLHEDSPQLLCPTNSNMRLGGFGKITSTLGEKSATSNSRTDEHSPKERIDSLSCPLLFRASSTQRFRLWRSNAVYVLAAQPSQRDLTSLAYMQSLCQDVALEIYRGGAGWTPCIGMVLVVPMEKSVDGIESKQEHSRNRGLVLSMEHQYLTLILVSWGHREADVLKHSLVDHSATSLRSSMVRRMLDVQKGRPSASLKLPRTRECALDVNAFTTPRSFTSSTWILNHNAKANLPREINTFVTWFPGSAPDQLSQSGAMSLNGASSLCCITSAPDLIDNCPPESLYRAAGLEHVQCCMGHVRAVSIKVWDRATGTMSVLGEGSVETEQNGHEYSHKRGLAMSPMLQLDLHSIPMAQWGLRRPANTDKKPPHSTSGFSRYLLAACRALAYRTNRSIKDSQTPKPQDLTAVVKMELSQLTVVLSSSINKRDNDRCCVKRTFIQSYVNQVSGTRGGFGRILSIVGEMSAVPNLKMDKNSPEERSHQQFGGSNFSLSTLISLQILAPLKIQPVGILIVPRSAAKVESQVVLWLIATSAMHPRAGTSAAFPECIYVSRWRSFLLRVTSTYDSVDHRPPKSRPWAAQLEEVQLRVSYVQAAGIEQWVVLEKDSGYEERKTGAYSQDCGPIVSPIHLPSHQRPIKVTMSLQPASMVETLLLSASEPMQYVLAVCRAFARRTSQSVKDRRTPYAQYWTVVVKIESARLTGVWLDSIDNRDVKRGCATTQDSANENGKVSSDSPWTGAPASSNHIYPTINLFESAWRSFYSQELPSIPAYVFNHGGWWMLGYGSQEFATKRRKSEINDCAGLKKSEMRVSARPKSQTMDRQRAGTIMMFETKNLRTRTRRDAYVIHVIKRDLDKVYVHPQSAYATATLSLRAQFELCGRKTDIFWIYVTTKPCICNKFYGTRSTDKPGCTHTSTLPTGHEAGLLQLVDAPGFCAPVTWLFPFAPKPPSVRAGFIVSGVAKVCSKRLGGVAVPVEEMAAALISGTHKCSYVRVLLGSRLPVCLLGSRNLRARSRVQEPVIIENSPVLASTLWLPTLAASARFIHIGAHMQSNIKASHGSDEKSNPGSQRLLLMHESLINTSSDSQISPQQESVEDGPRYAIVDDVDVFGCLLQSPPSSIREAGVAGIQPDFAFEMSWCIPTTPWTSDSCRIRGYMPANLSSSLEASLLALDFSARSIHNREPTQHQIEALDDSDKASSKPRGSQLSFAHKSIGAIKVVSAALLLELSGPVSIIGFAEKTSPQGAAGHVHASADPQISSPGRPAEYGPRYAVVFVAGCLLQPPLITSAQDSTARQHSGNERGKRCTCSPRSTATASAPQILRHRHASTKGVSPGPEEAAAADKSKLPRTRKSVVAVEIVLGSLLSITSTQGSTMKQYSSNESDTQHSTVPLLVFALHAHLLILLLCSLAVPRTFALREKRPLSAPPTLQTPDPPIIVEMSRSGSKYNHNINAHSPRITAASSLSRLLSATVSLEPLPRTPYSLPCLIGEIPSMAETVKQRSNSQELRSTTVRTFDSGGRGFSDITSSTCLREASGVERLLVYVGALSMYPLCALQRSELRKSRSLLARSASRVRQSAVIDKDLALPLAHWSSDSIYSRGIEAGPPQHGFNHLPATSDIQMVSVQGSTARQDSVNEDGIHSSNSPWITVPPPLPLFQTIIVFLKSLPQRYNNLEARAAVELVINRIGLRFTLSEGYLREPVSYRRKSEGGERAGLGQNVGMEHGSQKGKEQATDSQRVSVLSTSKADHGRVAMLTSAAPTHQRARASRALLPDFTILPQ